jgi:hypothetical protein
MNAQIQKLWTQAGGHYDGGNQHTWPQYTIDDPKKFVELIVRECGTVINSENYREHSKGWDIAIEWADGMIKQHFGVEP